MYQNENMEHTSMDAESVIRGLGVFLLVVFTALAFGFLLIEPIKEAEHYLQVYQNPVTVTATVTGHESYYDEGDTDYRSFISYDYNGIHYEKMEYETYESLQGLPPVGTQVNIQLSSKDPSRQINKLRTGGNLMYLGLIVQAISLALGYHWLQTYRLSRYVSGTPDTNTVQRDLKIKILGRFWGAFLLLCGLGVGVCYWRYSALSGKLPLIIAAVSGLFWLLCLVIGIRDYRHVRNEDFELRRDVLVDKEIDSDSDGTTYRLYYQSGDRKWRTSISKKMFDQLKIGDTIVAVYLPGRKKPTLHYDHQGNAK